MTDIREQILENKPSFFYTEDTVYHEEGVKEAMDKYALLILQHIRKTRGWYRLMENHGHNIEEYLEEIKTELNENNNMDSGSY